jgi:hypothetical protein
MIELSDEVLLRLAVALRKSDGPTPKCKIEVEDGHIVWDQDHLIIERKGAIRTIVGISELEPENTQFLEACLRIWMQNVEGFFCPINIASKRQTPEA